MSDNNQISVRGRVGTDPQLARAPGDRGVANFRLGSTRRIRDSATGEWRDADTEWFTVKAWGTLAEHVVTSINRGMPVIVQGVFSTEEWQSGEQMRYRKVITASAVAVDIRYGLVRYVKLARPAGTNGTTASGSEESADDATTSAEVAGADGLTDEALGAGNLEEQLGAELDPWARPVSSS